MHCADVPWRVAINECIELAKEFGGTDGHKYVNAVLGALGPKLRASEVAAEAAAAGKVAAAAPTVAEAAEPAPAAAEATPGTPGDA